MSLQYFCPPAGQWKILWDGHLPTEPKLNSPVTGILLQFLLSAIFSIKHTVMASTLLKTYVYHFI